MIKFEVKNLKASPSKINIKLIKGAAKTNRKIRFVQFYLGITLT